MARELFEKIHWLYHLEAELDALYHEASLRLGVADSVMRVLYAIHDHGGEACLLSDICRQSGLSKQTINSALRKLERQGILYLEQYKGRAKRACLTEKGRRLAGETASRLYDAECRAFADWPTQEIDAYIRLTERYLNDFRAQVAALPDGQKFPYQSIPENERFSR